MSGLPHLEVREAANGYAILVKHDGEASPRLTPEETAVLKADGAEG